MAVAVIGAGEMGRTVAHAISEYEQVVLVDSDDAQLASALDQIRRVQAARRIRGRSSRGVEEILGRLTVTGDVNAIAGCDLVIENITENRAAKRRLHRSIRDVITPDTVVAVNTSVIPLTELAEEHVRPGNVLGLHFMNPATEIRAVELIHGRRTDQKAVASVREWLALWGFTPLEVRRDDPGFVINRLLMPMVNQAAQLVADGVADAETVDQIFQLCLGHRTGPLATADLIGIDTVVDSIATLGELLSDDNCRPAGILLDMVRAGKLGRKTGTGFFDYRAGNDQKQPNS